MTSETPPAPDVGRLIERFVSANSKRKFKSLGEWCVEMGSRLCSVCECDGRGCTDCIAADALKEAADALAALQVRETELHGPPMSKAPSTYPQLRAAMSAAIAAREQAEADAASLRQQLNANAAAAVLENERANRALGEAEALRQAQARLREALNELKAHAEYTLDRSGQRTRPALFVPSVAKRVLEIVTPALASVDPIPVSTET